MSLSDYANGEGMPYNTKIWRHFVRNRANLRSYIRSLVSNHADAADLMQELGLVILDHQDVPSDVRQFSAWYRGIVRNLVAHHWRSTRRYSEVFSPSGLEGESPDVGTRTTEDTVASRSTLVACLEELDEQSRTLLTLRYMDGKTSDEIARQFRRSPSAIRMKIKRVRDSLKGRMNRS